MILHPDTVPDGDCPICGLRMIGAEVRDLYDGIAFWGCPACDLVARRFDGPGRINDWIEKTYEADA